MMAMGFGGVQNLGLWGDVWVVWWDGRRSVRVDGRLLTGPFPEKANERFECLTLRRHWKLVGVLTSVFGSTTALVYNCLDSFLYKTRPQN